ncbi:MAG: arginine N-succinyltransferase [Pseudomonadota bacterium]|jgi:arginine N-succinyltransferase
MMIVRPVERRDLAVLLELAGKTGVGMTSLPQDEQHLAARIERALNTWQGSLAPSEQGYLFVLEDSERQKVVGVSAIEVAVGMNEPWYNFRVGTLVHASKTLNVYKSVPTLFLSNDHTGYSELCTLFLDPDYRKDKNGPFLSKARFLFIAAFRQYFSSKMIAEMRGYTDENGRSPFWENVGRHFFSIEFAKADYLSGTGQKAFITELMPKHPLYVDFLAEEARAVIGQVHPHTAPARAVLETEGLQYQGYIDIFDGGPTLEANTDEVRAVRDCSKRVVVIEDIDIDPSGATYLVTNDSYLQFRAILIDTHLSDERLHLSSENAAALGVAAGDSVRIVSLFAPEIKK